MAANGWEGRRGRRDYYQRLSTWKKYMNTMTNVIKTGEIAPKEGKGRDETRGEPRRRGWAHEEEKMRGKEDGAREGTEKI